MRSSSSGATAGSAHNSGGTIAYWQTSPPLRPILPTHDHADPSALGPDV